MLALSPTESPEPRPKVPGSLVFEELNGRPLYYRGYREVLAGRLSPESIWGNSDIKALTVGAIFGFIHARIDRKRYLTVTNEPGLHLAKGNNLSNDIAIFERSALPTLRGTYFNVPPKVVVEVDIKIELDPEEFPAREADYIFEKSTKLLQFGVEKVIWATTHTRKLFVATPTEKWVVQNWDEDVPVLDGCVLNLAGLLEEEGIGW